MADGTGGGGLQGLGEEAVQWLLGQEAALSGKDWAGAGHWRFRPTRARQPTDELDNSAASGQPPAKKPASRFWTALPPSCT